MQSRVLVVTVFFALVAAVSVAFAHDASAADIIRMGGSDAPAAAVSVPAAEQPADETSVTPTLDDASEDALGYNPALFAAPTMASYQPGDGGSAPGQPSSDAMLPEGVDADPNSDMVEILVSGSGAMFPAELEIVDYSTDMVAIVLD